MRDPDGTIEFQPQKVVRRLKPNAAAKQFLHSELATGLVRAGMLVPYEFTNSNTVESPHVAFVSYPFEWCDAQLHLAAQLTLDISRQILSVGQELKDASAWNVIYQGNLPLFCDHLSFQPIVTAQWWAFGQFARNFLLPLVISGQRGLRPHQIYSTYRDGIPPDVARKMLGLKRYLTRYWPLMVSGQRVSATDAPVQKQGKHFHSSLYSFCQSMLNGGKPRKTRSHWADYIQTRQHYSAAAATDKYRQVAQWLESTKPAWVVDLGCNTGEYTLVAAAAGASVIAVDQDHDCIQELVLSQNNSRTIHPVVANLGDMVGGRGWCGDEFPSLMTRLHQKADVLLMLALIHHLAISEGVYLKKIAKMANHITRQYLIVELIDETDSMVLQLCDQRKRVPGEFSIAEQVAAFSQYFTTIASYSVPNTLRTLCLLQRK